MLVPIAPENDGGYLNRAISSYLVSVTNKHKKTMDIYSPLLATQLVVMMDKYIKFGLQSAIDYIYKKRNEECGLPSDHREYHDVVFDANGNVK